MQRFINKTIFKEFKTVKVIVQMYTKIQGLFFKNRTIIIGASHQKHISEAPCEIDKILIIVCVGGGSSTGLVFITIIFVIQSWTQKLQMWTEPFTKNC